MSKKKSKYKKSKKYNNKNTSTNTKATTNEKVPVVENKEKDIIEEVQKVEDTNIGNNILSQSTENINANVEVEKSIDCNSLKSTEKKHFFLLVLKLIGVHIKNFFAAIGCFIKNVFVHINDFFEDRAEELDRKIREIKDEEVIKNKRRKLDYEKYNTKRIYKDLQRAERYKNRASSRVNTEKYFEDKIEKEKINNKILVNAAAEADEEEKEAYTYANNMRKRDRIEKKKNEILELRRKKKEEHQKAKEEREKELERLNEERRKIEEKEAMIKAEEERLISETADVVKSLEQQFSFATKAKDEDPYNDLFEEFGNEEMLDEEDDDDIPNVDDIIKMAEEEQIKNVNYKQKHEDRINEPYEKFENENDVREIDEKLKSEILKLIDVPESETKEDFITEVEFPVTEDASVNKTEEEPIIETKSYIDTLMEENKTIGDLLGEEEEEEQKVEIPKSRENDPTVNIFAALRNANVKNKEAEEKKEKPEKQEFVPFNSKVRVSDKQDGFDNIKLKSEKNNGDFYDAEKLNIGSWTKTEEKIERAEEKVENTVHVEEEPYLKYKNPYETYGKYIKSTVQDTVREEKIEEKQEYTIESVFKDSERRQRTEINKESRAKKEDRKERKQHNDRKPKHAEEKGRNIVKPNLSSIFKAKQSTKRKRQNDFDEDLYTNKFIRNIIDIDDSVNKEKNMSKDIGNDMFKVEEDIFSEAYTKKIEEMNALENGQKQNEYQNDENDTVKILNVEQVNNDEIVMNAYVRTKPEYIHEPNEYYDNMLNKEDDIKINYNSYLAQDSYYPQEEIKTVRKENKVRTYEYDEEDDDKVSFGSFIKEMAANINTSISEIPENMRKRRESKNRIKRNQIYSTSYNRKGKRR